MLSAGAHPGLKSLIVCASLAIGFVLAQDSPPDPRTQDNQEQSSNAEPADGQPSEVSQSASSILSRGKNATKQSGGKLLDFRFYGEVMGVYDSGLTPAAATPQASSPGTGYGIEAGIGVSADRRWEHGQLTVEYRGRFREYARDMLFNGTDQFLSVAYGLEMRPHLALELKETAGTTTLANGEFAYLPIPSDDLLGIPSNELFDNRTNYSESQVDLIWDRTARLSFDFGGQGFLVRRDSAALAGLNGYSAHWDAAYRLTRHQVISAGYKYTHFDFDRFFGAAALQTAAIEYSVQLSHHLDLSIRAGGTRVDALGLTEVTLAPSIAAIIGQTGAAVTFSRILYVPNLSGQLVERLRHSSVRLDFLDGVSPGNGLYLTSRQTAATMGYSYSGYRRLTLGAHGGYNQLSAIGQSFGKYTNLEAGGVMTYEVVQGAHLEMRYDFRHYTTQDLFFRKDSNRVSLGFVYGPDTAPLPIW